MVKCQTRSRRVVGSNPIWDSDFFRVYVFPRIYIMSCCCYFSVSKCIFDLEMPLKDGETRPFTWDHRVCLVSSKLIGIDLHTTPIFHSFFIHIHGGDLHASSGFGLWTKTLPAWAKIQSNHPSPKISGNPVSYRTPNLIQPINPYTGTPISGSQPSHTQAPQPHSSNCSVVVVMFMPCDLATMYFVESAILSIELLCS